MNNKNLHRAKREKNDEFYTQYIDIEKECQHYVDKFKDQWIYLPCDTEDSHFWKYFVDHFHEYGLKRLTATHINLDGKPSYRLDYDGSDTIKTALQGNGDFRSDACIELLKESDIVVTNPPFSLFREFVALLEKYNKKYLIIGNMNAITYKEIFPLIKENKMWLGVSITSGDRKFNVPDDYKLEAAGCGIDDDGKKFIRVKGVRWFTNLEHNKRHEKIDLYKHYNPEEYPKYDNYDAINVDKTCEIPMDYDGVTGVPITFLDKYCKEQFEIIGCACNGSNNQYDYFKPSINGRFIYSRILIKRIG